MAAVHIAPEQIPMRIKELERSKIAGHLQTFQDQGGKVTVLAHGDRSPSPVKKQTGRQKMATSPAFSKKVLEPKMTTRDEEEG